MINRFELIDGEMVRHPFGKYIEHADYQRIEAERNQAVSDLGYTQDAAREEYERTRNQNWE